MVPTVIAGLPSPCTRKALYYVLENKGAMPPTHSVYQPQGPKREKVERGEVLKKWFWGLPDNCLSLEIGREGWLFH